LLRGRKPWQKQLREMRHRKRKLVDPLQFEMSIQAEDLAGYVPAFGWEMSPPTEKQLKALEKWGIFRMKLITRERRQSSWTDYLSGGQQG